MKKVCIQAGHKGITVGATGAPGERDWTTKIVPMVATLLREKGLEVYETNSLADTDNKVTSTDWDLFLAIHYDADIYNDRGGFVDFPDPSVDQVNARSKELAKALSDHYFPTTGIPVKASRSNANTKFYYMWSELTANTPCVLIECGVGWRKPEDYDTLRKYDLVAKAISDGVLKGFGLYDSVSDELAICGTKCQELEKELDEMRASRNKWKADYAVLEEKYAKDIQAKDLQISTLQTGNSELTAQLSLVQGQYKSLVDEKNVLQGKVEALEGELEEAELEYTKMEEQLTEQIARLSDSIATSSREMALLREKIAKGLKGYTRWELLKEYFSRRK